jgi:hypothetical protein
MLIITLFFVLISKEFVHIVILLYLLFFFLSDLRVIFIFLQFLFEVDQLMVMLTGFFVFKQKSDVVQ